MKKLKQFGADSRSSGAIRVHARISAVSIAPAATTLDQLRRRPRPPLAWEVQQCARNFRVQRSPIQLAREAGEAASGRESQLAGWIVRGL